MISTEERDQLVAEQARRLDELIDHHRAYREMLVGKYGHIDQFRTIRDTATGLHINEPDVHATVLMLAAAIDRLAQLPDFNPAADLDEVWNMGEVPDNEA